MIEIVAMSIKDMITHIIYKNSNDIRMNDLEILIRDEYINYITYELFKKNKVNVLVGLDDLY